MGRRERPAETPVEKVRRVFPHIIDEIQQLHRERAAMRALLAPVMGVEPVELEDWTDAELEAYADLALQKISTFVL